MAAFANDGMNGYIWQNIIDNARSGGGNWAYPPVGGGTFRVFENRAYCEMAGHIYHKAEPPSADYAVACDYLLKTDMGSIGVAGRIVTSAQTYYTAYYAGGAVVLAKMVAGAFTVLGTESVPWVAGTHRLALEMVDTTIGAIWDGDEAVVVSDGSITAAGRAGIRAGSPNDAHIGKHIDNFLASDDTTLTVPGSSLVWFVGI